MIPLLTNLLGGRWRRGGHRSSLTELVVNDEITITWHIEDVQEVRPDLTDEQAHNVLWHAKKWHDATIGINWEVLDHWCDYLYRKEE